MFIEAKQNNEMDFQRIQFKHICVRKTFIKKPANLFTEQQIEHMFSETLIIIFTIASLNSIKYYKHFGKTRAIISGVITCSGITQLSWFLIEK